MDGPHINGEVLQVNHASYGTLFSAMIDGHGELITEFDEEGEAIPFLSTDEILKQIEKFGFYVVYDVKSNLPMNIITLLQELYELGYDKITRVLVRATGKESGSIIWRPQVIVMKTEHNTDLLSYGAKITDKVFKDKLAANTIMNLTYEEDMKWDWLTYMANISDLLDENIDPRDDFAELHSLDPFDPAHNEGLTPYEDPVESDEENPEEGD